MCKHALCDHNGDPKGINLSPKVSGIKSIGNYLPFIAAFSIVLVGISMVASLLQILLYFFLFLLILSVVLVWNSFNFDTKQMDQKEKERLSKDPENCQLKARIQSKGKEAANRLSLAIQIPTISYDEPERNESGRENLLKFHRLLQDSFPLVHQNLEKKIVNQYSLVFKWDGTEEQKGNLPFLLTAHMDVVPALDSHLWKEDPFKGVIKDGEIWGRGSIDDKHAVMGIMESVEELISQGFKPKRTLYIAFGHDEEISGNEGAKSIAKYFESQKIQFSWMLDEGLFVLKGILPGMKSAVAMICVTEKGSLTSEFTSTVSEEFAGHSSTPGASSAIGVLCSALLKMEKNPMPSYLEKGTSVRSMFEWCAPHFDYPFKLLFTNLWLFAPLVKLILVSKKTTATTVRTTTALTVIQGGNKVNVLPREAKAMVNHRIHPNDSVKGVLHYSNEVIQDPRIVIREVNSIPPAPVSSTESEGFENIRTAIAQVMPEVLVAPAIMVGNTDTRHYWGVCKDIYRFSPTRLHSSETSMFHGVNERIKIDNYLEIIQFYANIIKNANK